MNDKPGGLYTHILHSLSPRAELTSAVFEAVNGNVALKIGGILVRDRDLIRCEFLVWMQSQGKKRLGHFAYYS